MKLPTQDNSFKENHIICGFLSCCHCLIIMNKTTMNIHICIFVWMYVLNSVGYVHIRKVAELHRSSIFKFWKNCQAIFQNGCSIFHLLSKIWGCQFFHILDNTWYCLFFFYYNDHNVSHDFVEISLMNNFEKYFMCLLTICTFSG